VGQDSNPVATVTGSESYPTVLFTQHRATKEFRDGSFLVAELGERPLSTASSVSGDGRVLFSGGTTFVDGTVTAPGGIMIVQGATVSGFGTLNGSVVNAGQINPGRIGSAGVLTIMGDYTQTMTGILTTLSR
jgi:hypothetical protein